MSEEKPKPVLDEHTLAKLLEAAYVLQEHNREVQEMEIGFDLKREEAEAQQEPEISAPSVPGTKQQPDAPHADYTFTLAQIVATQHQIQIRNLELDKAMSLVTERLTEMAHADGAAIGMVYGRKVRYAAVAGARSLAIGTEVSADKALCLPCIKNGQVFRCPDVNPEFLVDTQECRRRGIQSLIAVPIFHEGGVAAGLEIYYSAPHGFSDQDIHTCQLMAGLITEALARDEEATWKESVANERAMMLEALERLKPNLTALVDPAPANSKATSTATKMAALPSLSSDVYSCAKCGHGMAEGERFCGQCGTARDVVTKPAATTASTLNWTEEHSPAAAPQANAGHESIRGSENGFEHDEMLDKALEQQFPDLFGEPEASNPEASVEAPTAAASTVSSHTVEPQAESARLPELSSHPSRELETGAENLPLVEEGDLSERNEKTADTTVDEPAVATNPTALDWSSAASAKEFLEKAQKPRSGLARFWETRRGDIYLAVAVILVACVIRWGIWSDHAVSATANPVPTGAASPRKAPEPELSMFDRMMISLGLAETPETPEDKGNPSTKVWIDVHTALYYCPGADAYGKTPKGKYMTQRDAQLDSYEPAYRKACN